MIKYNINSVIVFDFNEALNMQGNTGPYLQYAYARAANILGKVEPEILEEIDLRDVSIPAELTFEERELIRRMAEFPATLGKAAQLLQPPILAEYTFNLASTFMNFYEAVPVLTARPPHALPHCPPPGLPPDPGQRPKHPGHASPGQNVISEKDLPDNSG